MNEDFDPRAEYDKLAAIYDDLNAPCWPFEPKYDGLVEFLSSWPGGQNILELAVATGNIAAKLYLQGYHHITGVDFSAAITARLKVKCPRVQLRLEDLKTTSLAGFDWILLLENTLARIENKEALFRRLFDEADPGSHIFIDAPAHPTLCDPAEADHQTSRCALSSQVRFHLDYRYIQKTASYQSGTLTIADNQTGQTFEHRYAIWEMLQEELKTLMSSCGFQLAGCGPASETGYTQDVLVFIKP